MLWMDKIRSHQIEAMVETIVCWYLQGIIVPELLNGGAGVRPSTVGVLSEHRWPRQTIQN